MKSSQNHEINNSISRKLYANDQPTNSSENHRWNQTTKHEESTKKLRVEVSWWGHVKGHGVNEQDARMQTVLISKQDVPLYH